jgi:hypothetical protein
MPKPIQATALTTWLRSEAIRPPSGITKSWAKGVRSPPALKREFFKKAPDRSALAAIRHSKTDCPPYDLLVAVTPFFTHGVSFTD